MKKFVLSALAVLACATTTSATTPTNGSAMGGVARGYLPGESVLPVVSFNCYDPKFGQFDMCVDMIFVIQQPRRVETLMDITINPAYSQSHQRIIMRYAYHKMRVREQNDFATIIVKSKAGEEGYIGPIRPGNSVYTAIRVSEDGGQTWSQFYREVR